MIALHAFLSRVIMLYTLIGAGWGLLLAVRRRPASDSYRTTLLIAEGLFAVEALVGIVLLAGGRRPADLLHFLYGLLGVAVLPIVMGTVGTGKRRDSLWLGLATLFLFGVAVRALMTGAP
ncbi:MAG TPA: hypothetical protein VKY56_04680 [Chloroflexota bacterium]|nr:hypothetical protein [Chloroflexota bacterium]